jgi:hypothetical protein
VTDTGVSLSTIDWVVVVVPIVIVPDQFITSGLCSVNVIPFEFSTVKPVILYVPTKLELGGVTGGRLSPPPPPPQLTSPRIEDTARTTRTTRFIFDLLREELRGCDSWMGISM